MKATTALVLGALLTAVSACGNDSGEQQAAVPTTFLMPQCSPADPQCQLAEPPRLNERPAPGEQ